MTLLSVFLTTSDLEVVRGHLVPHICVELHLIPSNPAARFSKVPKTFRAQKANGKTSTRLFCKAGLFMCCKGYKKENNCKVSCLETPSL